MATDFSNMTRIECLAEAQRWLDKAVAFEAEGKSDKMVSLAFNKALDAENAAFDKKVAS